MASIQVLLLLCLGAVFAEVYRIISLLNIAPGIRPYRDPCRYFRCQNGGRCVAPADRPRCICRRPYTGRSCENSIGFPPSRDPCTYFRCQNGGRCVAPNDVPRCVCPRGYKGERCEKSIVAASTIYSHLKTFEESLVVVRCVQVHGSDEEKALPQAMSLAFPKSSGLVFAQLVKRYFKHAFAEKVGLPRLQRQKLGEKNVAPSGLLATSKS
ncbi:SLIT 2 protein [Elysia marginata]|uniref:SLIT 2 protein n=1 Tax=Elysia marginata TaxID=1093978 RepID=A0AAV4G1W6_9GAST|nr:SLIT 2 protein [Elysia marginata]